MSLVAGKLRYLGRGLCCEHAVDLHLFHKVEADDLALETCVLINKMLEMTVMRMGVGKRALTPPAFFKFFY